MNITNIFIQLLFDKWQMRGLLGFTIGFVPIVAQAAESIKVVSALLGLVLVALSVYKQILEVQLKKIELMEQQRKAKEE